MNTLKNDIKNKDFKPVYLLYGEETFLVNYYKKLLIQSVCGEDTMNLSVYQGEDIEVNRIADDCMTVPFFAEHKLIVIENSGMLKSSSEDMANILKNIPSTTCILFVESEVDKRNKVYKTISTTGHVCPFERQTENELQVWTARILAAQGKKISKEDVAFFIKRVGNDMYNISNEAAKLIAYAGEEEVITREYIELLCSELLEDKVFDMINAMAKKNTDEAIRLYGDLLTLRVAPLKILAIMSKKYNQLLVVKDMKKNGHSGKDIAPKIGVPSFYVNQYLSQAEEYQISELKQIINSCVNAESDIKSGRTEDKYAVELLIISYSQKG